MGITEEDRRMEGWLYLIRSNRLGLQYSRKRYFVLEDNALNCYKAVPASRREDPIRSALINSCIRVTDNGRASMHRSVFYIFTLYSSSNHNDQLKLGARSSEEAASWIRSLMEAALKECPNKDEKFVACSKRRRHSLRLSRTRARSLMHSIDWTVYSSVHADPMASDVIAPSPWMIFGCKNGLRLFKESNEGDFLGKHWDDHPAIMAVGVVDATSEAIFRTVMSLGPSRSEWDFSLLEGRVVEHLDGHTDIIHKKLHGDWLPWGMNKRDLLLRRYWRREDDGTYVILYHSVFHQNCRPERGYIRACLKSGGYVISPVNQGKQSVVKHMLAIDWKFWRSYMFTSSAKYVTIRMLGRVAALREFFRAKLGNCTCSDYSSGELTREIGLPYSEKEHIKVEVQTTGENSKSADSAEAPQQSPSGHANTSGSFLQLNDAADEFFDVIDESDNDQTEALWPSDEGMHSQLVQEQRQHKLSTAAVFVKKLHDFAVQKKGYIDLQEASMGDMAPCSYGTTLPKDPSCTMTCSWAMADPTSFLIRGESYLRDQQKIKANSTLMQMVAADWLNSDKREDDLGGRPGGVVQKYAAQGGSEFFFIVNIQIPGSSTYSLALYYMMDTPLENVPLLESFVKGDDAFRNSRFKLIPYISKGSWIVKQSVGKKACLVGQALASHYFRGSNYLEVGIDAGSSTVARGVVSLVLGYLNNLVIELAFLIQGNTQEELPELLLGTCRLNHLDASKSVSINPW
ncbi:protein ENHANCED DISEASE RESISTANCE 2-like isoform X1 [Phoenix dactylifera]|uniref:Protein ENHANCED DISEASE RESISTANCE 2-like isoform X1 n=1 Tax=Phoenix dactylifera TaxID=42345 RepID=A0A8B8ZDX5_PHODC|nr:protein ENHANCED DISEASE RESISTANCE 2-like isoform X1 [Phoenix dactylifera]